MTIVGWNNIDEVAMDIYQSIHDSLLQGDLVCAWRGSQGDLRQFVITKRLDDPSLWMIGMMTSGYTMLLPKVPKEYFTEIFLPDLKKQYKLTIKDLNEYFSN